MSDEAEPEGVINPRMRAAIDALAQTAVEEIEPMLAVVVKSNGDLAMRAYFPPGYVSSDFVEAARRLELIDQAEIDQMATRGDEAPKA